MAPKISLEEENLFTGVDNELEPFEREPQQGTRSGLAGKRGVLVGVGIGIAIAAGGMLLNPTPET